MGMQKVSRNRLLAGAQFGDGQQKFMKNPRNNPGQIFFARRVTKVRPRRELPSSLSVFGGLACHCYVSTHPIGELMAHRIDAGLPNTA
jgi:hypothetical protein